MSGRGYYRLDVWYDRSHVDTAADRAIARVVGREPNGSGGGFGQRVLEFYFEQRPALRRAVERLRRRCRGASFQWATQRFERDGV